MNQINQKIQLIKQKVENGSPITIMIVGLGSVGNYLLDYLVSRSDAQIHIVVAGRNYEKMERDVNIIRTAATIRQQLRSKIDIVGDCDLNNIESIAHAISKFQPDFIVNSSRVYSGLKYGSISWSHLRAYGIWAPLSMRYARNIMEAYASVGSHAISINTSYSDTVIPWLKSAGKSYFDFGSGNLNHLVPRMKFHIAQKHHIDNLNEIDVTLATSHFHDVVISKEGQDEGWQILVDFSQKGKRLVYDMNELLQACAISMPVDQKRNMMNASSNYNIIDSILKALKENVTCKIHVPGVDGEIGGYPVLIDGKTATTQFDTNVFSLDEMRKTNRQSIYLDGVENIENGILFYTDELINKVQKVFHCTLSKAVKFEEIDDMDDWLIENIINKVQ